MLSVILVCPKCNWYFREPASGFKAGLGHKEYSEHYFLCPRCGIRFVAEIAGETNEQGKINYYQTDATWTTGFNTSEN